MSNGAFPDAITPPTTPAATFGQGLGGGIGGLNIPTDGEDRSLQLDIGEDGGVTVTEVENEPEEEADSSFDANLAEKYPGILASLASNLLDGIAADEQSRAEWVEEYKSGLDLLGLKINDASQGSSTQGSGSIAGAFNSRVKHPLLLQACLKAQALERGELLPAAGPVKVTNDGPDTPEREQLAADLEDDMNHWLTITASEYYPDTDRMLFSKAFSGVGFKKVFRDPIKGRPMSLSVEMPDLIVSNDATDMANATRVTHQIMMTHQQYRDMIDAGVWVETDIGQVPAGIPGAIDTKEAQIRGIQAMPQRAQDVPHTIYECYTYLDLKAMGGGTDDPASPELEVLPYKVTLDKDTQTVLEIRRNWRKDDERKRARKRFVKFPFIPAMGFLELGYLHILGQHAKALTAIERILIDAGMFSNFPGGVKARGRSDPNQIMPGPGQFVDVDVPMGMTDVRSVLMPLPYNGPSAELIQLWEIISQNAQQMAGTVDLEIGEGRTNVPVGTIMSMIEQQTQMMTAVHKRDHQAQQEEFTLLRELFIEDPEALWRDNPQPKRQWTKEMLEDLSMVPASDPNVPAQIHRIQQSYAISLLAQGNPNLYDQREVNAELLRNIKVGQATIDRILLPPQPADDGSGAQAAMMALTQAQLAIEQMKAQADQTRAQSEAMEKIARVKLDWQRQAGEMLVKAKDRESRERIAELNGRVQLLLKGVEMLGQVPNDPVNSEFQQPKPTMQ